MLRLSPPGRARVEQTEQFDVRIAGAESNVAVACARLGLRTRWLSRLPDDGRGRRVVRSLAAHGVDVSSVIWDDAPDARLGVFYVEWGVAPRPVVSVIYDRAGSAASRLTPTDLPDAVIAPCRHLHVTGITPALSPSCAEAVAHAVRTAKRLGKTVSFDVNYRTRLWPADEAARVLGALAEGVDVLITSSEDAARLWGIEDDVTGRLRDRFGARNVAVTLPEGGAIMDDGYTAAEILPVRVAEIVDRLGAGDAFAAGLLTGFLERGDLVHGGNLGMAMAALKLTTPGDEFFGTRAEVEALAAGNGPAASVHR
jgi:2-dehydro-3-deoxygluconokinase